MQNCSHEKQASHCILYWELRVNFKIDHIKAHIFLKTSAELLVIAGHVALKGNRQIQERLTQSVNQHWPISELDTCQTLFDWLKLIDIWLKQVRFLLIALNVNFALFPVTI